MYEVKNMGRGFIVSTALLLATLPSPVFADSEVRAVRVALAQDHTQLILDSNTPIRFSLTSLRNPDRVMLDLEHIELSAALLGLAAAVGDHHPYISRVHVVRAEPNIVRVELGLKAEVEPRISSLRPQGRYGYRLILDIYPVHGIPAVLAQEQQSTHIVAGKISVEKPSGAAAESADSIPAVPTVDTPHPPQPVFPAVVPQKSATLPTVEAVGADEILLAVRINRLEPAKTILMLRRRSDGRLLMRGTDLHQWRMRLPSVSPVSHRDEAYYPLDALEGLSYQLDEASQTLLVIAGPGLFEATALQGASAGFNVPMRGPPGGFMNYDVVTTHAQHLTTTSGLMELGVFGGWGSGVSGFLAQDIGSNARYIRLDTTWTLDRPADRSTVRLGDAFSGTGSWGHSVRFGGIQWATNFATQPHLITFPLPGLTGEAALPSTADLYINDALRMRREVPSGPFSIQDLPVVTGRGEARLVVRDLLGRETVIIQPYYASPRLLQKGLQEYSYESGFIRENFGTASNEYGRFLVAGTHRLGLTDRLTGDVRGEFLRDQQTVGAGGAWVWPEAGIFTTALAASHSRRGMGGLLGVGFERQSRDLSVGANTQLTTDRFTQLGLQPGQLPPKQSSQAFLGVSFAPYGSLALSYTQQTYRDQESVKLVNASYSVSLGQIGFLSLSVLHFLSRDAKTILGLTFSTPLGERTSGSISATTQPGSRQAQMQVQRSLPAGSGYGYRLGAGLGDAAIREASVSLQNNVGTYTLEASQVRSDTAFRASASGSVALLGGNAYLSRRVSDSFAVVRVPDYANVRIYADNQPIAVTGSDGNALVPRLRAYEKNLIRIEQADLPLDAKINAVQFEAVPYFRSGLLLQFPVKRSRGGLITVVLDNGVPLPVGAVVQIIGENEEFPAGQRGEVYLTELGASNHLRVSWRSQSCEITVPFPDTPEPLPHLGTYTCTGVKP